MAHVDDAVETKTCPKCSHDCEPEALECPRCQIVFDKLARNQQRRRDSAAVPPEFGGGSCFERLAGADQLLIRQQTERIEAFIGFEQTNAYTILDDEGKALFLAAEESNVWLRQLLKSMRPFRIHLVAPEGGPALTLERPFRFFFAEVRVLDPRGNPIGTVLKRWSLINRRYTVVDATEGRGYEIHGPLFRPWTFRILRHGSECGMIRKKWSGSLREIFTDADFFGIQFPRDADVRLKTVFLGAVFLIDFMHFEDNHQN